MDVRQGLIRLSAMVLCGLTVGCGSGIYQNTNTTTTSDPSPSTGVENYVTCSNPDVYVTGYVANAAGIGSADELEKWNRDINHGRHPARHWI
jgi:hypothetical protein